MEPPLTPVEAHFTPHVEEIKSTPLKSKTPDAGAAEQAGVRKKLGPYNNPDMLVCELHDFLEHYIPCQDVTTDEVDTCLQEMVSERIADKIEGESYRWSEYGQYTPSQLDATEPVVFEPLKKIVDHVLNFVKKEDCQEAGMHFMLVPYTTLTSDIPGSNHKIDGCFVSEPLKPPNTKVANRIINVPMEFKKDRNPKLRAAVHLQILGACHHIMNEDIRRMWIYGFTFEDDRCSVWYFSRSHSVKAATFDWIKNPQTLIRVLLAFAKATPSELGLDVTVHLGPENDDKTASYVYQVPTPDGSRFFKTVRAVSDPRPMAIAGRTTRVWKVVEVTSASGKHPINQYKRVILKDVWLNEGSKTEAENLDAIFEAVDTFVTTELEKQGKKNPTANQEQLLKQVIEDDSRFKSFDQASKDRLCVNLTNQTYKSLFLTKLHAWKGAVCKPLGQNLSRCPTFFSASSPEELEKENREAQSVLSANTRHSTVENPTQPMLGDKQRKEQDAEYAARRFVPKRQSRFIYEEVCTTLQNLNTLGEVVDILCQTMDAMHILFLAGWVHRDLSSNNIMAHHSNGRWTLKLADLEFSRLVVTRPEGSADPRTGTPFFMPVEVLSREHLLSDYYILNDDDSTHVGSEHDALGDDVGENEASETDASDDDIWAEGGQTDETLATQLNASAINQDYVDNLQRFTNFPSKVPVITNPHWHEVPGLDAVVVHNYQHDLESIWWILLWIVTCHINCEGSAKVMNRYFDHDVQNFADRVLLFTRTLSKIQSCLQKDIKKGFAKPLEKLRKSMYMAYLTREVFGHLKLPESYSTIQVEFSRVLRAIRAKPGPWRDIRLQKVATVEPLLIRIPGGAAKRERDQKDDSVLAEDEKAVKRSRTDDSLQV